MKTPSLLLLLVSSIASGAVTVSAHLNGISGKGNERPSGYVMPLVSNGSLSIHLDPQGTHNSEEYSNSVNTVLWEGRRMGGAKTTLFSFGHFRQTVSFDGVEYDTPDTWSQTIDAVNAEMMCKNTYGGSLEIKSEIFVHAEKDIVAIRKTFTALKPIPDNVCFRFRYDLSSEFAQFVMPKRMNFSPSWNGTDNCIDISYSAWGFVDYEGIISMYCDCPSAAHDVSLEDLSFSTEMNLKPGEAKSVTFYLSYSDDFEGNDFRKGIDGLKSTVRDNTFDSLFASHKAVWNDRMGRSYVNLPDDKIQRAYVGGLYQLLSNATKWSFPVGIGPWDGRYFAFDELYCYLAVAGCNILDVAGRVPQFRKKTLKRACERTRNSGARYPWETLENGMEGAPQPYGFWYDHVFHMSHVCTTMWTQYQYTNDMQYLKNVAYPVIRECCRFFLRHMCYTHPDGSITFGKTTDLERMGPAVENPFFSSCGAIWSFEIAVRAAEILGGADPELCGQFWKMAEGLRKTLPNDGTKYIPYKGCEVNSIAVATGMYPYQVLSTDDQKELNAIMDFYNERYSAGNMYAVCSGLCPWYASWIASAMSNYGIADKSLSLLQEASAQIGYFAEHFEINEKDVIRNPWFTTAAGNYVNAVNQILLLNRGDDVFTCYSAPEQWKDFSFCLPCFGNMLVEVCVKKGEMTKCKVTVNDSNLEISPKTLYIPERFVNEKKISKAVRPLISKKGALYCISLNPSTVGREGLELLQ